ncbi:YadA-like family protein [Burkholderia dolosa]|uniref:YadA family autotransporter adhesin n=1 Tax=Burkholderia dolosa TaxID=152500 RepID=UPI00158FF907|nr:YadA-like family protein [Burkholderia dolosa]MBR8456691.1 YadA-like family protein [Burkholderia dolosa]
MIKRCKVVSDAVLHAAVREMFQVCVVLVAAAGIGGGVLFSSDARARAMPDDPYVGYEASDISRCVNGDKSVRDCLRWDNANASGVRGTHLSQMAGGSFAYLTSRNGTTDIAWSGVWAGNKSAGLFYGDDPLSANRMVIDAEGTTIAGNKLVLSSTQGINVSGSRITNIAAGGQATDAVNVSQLSSAVDTLGGGAKVNPNGTIAAPKYQVGGITYGNVGDAISAAAEIGRDTDPNAVEYDDEAKSAVTLSGKSGTALKNVSAGAINATSLDAVNGSQLYGESKSVASALGGTSTVDAAGKVTAPTYSLDGGKSTTHNVGDAMSNLDGRVTMAATNVDELQDDFVESGLVDKRTGKVIEAATSEQLNAAIARIGDNDWVQIGKGANATPRTIAIGKDAKAGVEGLAGAIAIGEGARAAASGSRYVAAPVAVGDHATVEVRNGSAFGGSARVAAGATWSVALGADSVATRVNTVSVGNEREDLQRQIVNVAAGTQDTDAVNVAQLHGAATSLANAIGGGATVDENGHIAVHPIEVGGHKYTTISEAVQAAAAYGAAYGATDSLAVRYDLDSHGKPNYGSVTLGGPSVAPVMLSNVADGKSRYDAVNYGQLYELRSDVENRFGTMDDRVSKIETDGGDGRVVTMVNLRSDANNVAAGSRSTVDGDAGTTVALGANSAVQASGGTAIGAGADAHAINSIAIGQATSARGENSTVIGQGATAWGNNSVAIGADSVAEADNSVSFGNSATGTTRTLTNVSAGVAPTDAVNVQQLNESVGGLRSQVEHDRADANGGTASAVAIASLPQAPAPGKSVVAVGGGTYAGQSALAVGLSTYVGRWIFKASGSTNTRGTVAGGVGAGFVW